MAEYIDRKAAIDIVTKWFDKINQNGDICTDGLRSIPAADVVERKTGKNVAIEYYDCDQFVCSECGIELQDWRRVERDEDDGDITYHEYRLRFCPNCGAKIEES